VKAPTLPLCTAVQHPILRVCLTASGGCPVPAPAIIIPGADAYGRTAEAITETQHVDVEDVGPKCQLCDFSVRALRYTVCNKQEGECPYSNVYGRAR